MSRGLVHYVYWHDIILSLCQLFLDISNTCFALVSKSHWQPVPGGLLLAPHDTKQHQLFVDISNTCFALVSKSHWQPVPGGLLLAPHNTEQHQLFVVISNTCFALTSLTGSQSPADSNF